MRTENFRTYLSLLREAREQAQKDSENFEALVHAFERIGSMEIGQIGQGFGDYQQELLSIARLSPLSNGRPLHLHTDVEHLFSLVRMQRNDTMHEGSTARNLVRHSLELSLILEHAIMHTALMQTASDLMVRDVSFASLDHPISYIRQQMLMNAFS